MSQAIVGELDGKVALVTGAGSGIGEACARRLAAAGARVLVADVVPERTARVVADLGPTNARAHTVDVTNPESCTAMVRAAVDAFGRLDIAVNNAGVGSAVGPDDPYPVEAWRNVMAVNLDGVYYSLRAEVPVMLQQGAGAIVNMASMFGVVGFGGNFGYVASKHGVVGLTRAAALQLAGQGVRVNAVAPGVIDTPMAGRNAPARDAVAAKHPMGRIGTPGEVAELVFFLASARSSFCTGGVYSVDGGYTAE